MRSRTSSFVGALADCTNTTSLATVAYTVAPRVNPADVHRELVQWYTSLKPRNLMAGFRQVYDVRKPGA